MPIRVKVLKRTTLRGTIDKHDPLVVTFRVLGGPRGPFRVTFVTVNWGRGYDPGEFKRNVLRVLNHVGEREYVILLIQELDEEPDPAHEKKVFRSIMEPGTTLVGWNTREPIAVSPGVRVHRERKTLTMGAGLDIGAPQGTGPDRFFVECCVVIEGVHIGCGNQHPHRDLNHPKVQEARRGGHRVTRARVRDMDEHCDFIVHGGDMNDKNYPKTHPRERVIYSRHLSTIRLVRPKKEC